MAKRPSPPVTPPRRLLGKPVRVVRNRPRLFAAAAIGAVIVVATPADWRLAPRLLIGWDAGVALYLVLAVQLFASASLADMRDHAKLEDEGRVGILILTAAAALASLGAILAEVGIASAGGARNPLGLLLATTTIILSWLFTHSMFAVHYAHEFYDARAAGEEGLALPGGETEPDYGDFVYFSLVIGMTSQVSDIGVISRSIRRTVAAHGVVAFFFNAALLALMVNIAASAI